MNQPLEKQPVELDFEEPLPLDISVQLSEKLEKQRRKQAELLAEAKAFEQLGSKVIKAKQRTIAALGRHAEAIGIRAIGHGRIVLAGDHADNAVTELDAYIQQLRNQVDPVDPNVIAELLNLKRAFNQQLMDTGDMFLKADRSVSDSDKEKRISLAFPAGAQMAMAVTGPKAELPNHIEDEKSAS